MSKEQNANPVSVEDLLRAIEKMGESNRAAFLEAAERMAGNIVNPPPTDAQKEAQLRALTERAEAARANDAIKAHRRLHCIPPADPNRPHRRPIDNGPGSQWGGQTVIAWAYSCP